MTLTKKQIIKRIKEIYFHCDCPCMSNFDYKSKLFNTKLDLEILIKKMGDLEN